MSPTDHAPAASLRVMRATVSANCVGAFATRSAAVLFLQCAHRHEPVGTFTYSRSSTVAVTRKHAIALVYVHRSREIVHGDPFTRTFHASAESAAFRRRCARGAKE